MKLNTIIIIFLQHLSNIIFMSHNYLFYQILHINDLLNYLILLVFTII
jgi:hypothetical protein